MDQDTQATGSIAETLEPARPSNGTAEKWQVQWVALDSVHLNPDNPRHNDPAVEPVMQSIARFGFRVPIVVNRRTNLIEAGNTRWKAAQRMGLTEIPVIFADDDEVTALAFALADNRTAEIATWDEPSLADLLKRLEAEGDLLSTGFSDDDRACWPVSTRRRSAAGRRPSMPSRRWRRRSSREAPRACSPGISGSSAVTGYCVEIAPSRSTGNG